MWDDYGFIRDGCVPRSAYGSNPLGVISFSPATVPDSANIGTLIGYLSVVGGTGLSAFSLANNLYFTLVGNQIRVKGPLKAGSYALNITANSSAGKIIQSFIVTVTPTAEEQFLADSLNTPLLDSEGINILDSEG